MKIVCWYFIHSYFSHEWINNAMIILLFSPLLLWIIASLAVPLTFVTKFQMHFLYFSFCFSHRKVQHFLKGICSLKHYFIQCSMSLLKFCAGCCFRVLIAWYGSFGIWSGNFLNVGISSMLCILQFIWLNLA